MKKNDVFLILLRFVLAMILITIQFICIISENITVAKIVAVVCAILLGIVLGWREK